MSSFRLNSHHLAITVESSIFEASDGENLATEFKRFEGERFEAVDVDLRRVETIDSCGVGALVSLKERLCEERGDCPMALCNAGPKVISVINLLRLDRIFQVETAG